MVERRFHSPYRHWVAGFGFEVLVFVAAALALIGVALLVAWVRG